MKYLSVKEEFEEDPILIKPPSPNLSSLTHASSHAFNGYAEITHYLHKKKITISKSDIAKRVLPNVISYTIGAAATLGYIGVSQKAAKGNIINYYLNPAGAVTLNTILNGYFFSLVLADVLDPLLSSRPKVVNDVLNELQDFTPGKAARLLRILKQAGLNLVIFTPAIASAVPFFFLDKASGDSDLTATIVLLSATMLQYNGVKAILYKGLPTLYAPFQSVYRKLDEQARKRHKINSILTSLKSAHQSAISSARVEVLKLLQTKNEEELTEIYALLSKDEPNQADSLLLLTKLLQLAKDKPYTASPMGRLILQIVSLVLTIQSLPGYFIKTVEGISEYANWDHTYKEWLLGSAIFLVSVWLSLDVGWMVGGDLYDLAAYACHGVKTAWQQSTSTWDFVKKAWQHKASVDSWHNIIKLPLPIQQNPRIMLSIIGFLYAFSYYSTQTSTFLNEETLGEDYSKYLDVGTILSVMLFNSYAVDKVLGKFQQSLMRIFGSNKSKEQLRLELFLQNQENLVEKMSDSQFLNILDECVENPALSKVEIEKTLEIFLGNKTPRDIFGCEHKYSKRTYSQLIPCMKEDTIENLSRVSFFSKPQNSEKKPLLSASPDFKLNYATGSTVFKSLSLV